MIIERWQGIASQPTPIKKKGSGLHYIISNGKNAIVLSEESLKVLNTMKDTGGTLLVKAGEPVTCTPFIEMPTSEIKQ